MVKREATGSSKILVTNYMTTLHHNQEDHNPKKLFRDLDLIHHVTLCRWYMSFLPVVLCGFIARHKKEMPFIAHLIILLIKMKA
jgi:hypothetical protein